MKTMVVYKLFEKDTENNLYPLFIDKNNAYPMGEWIKAENIKYHPGFASRPGLHCGQLPAAPHLMSYGKNGEGYYKGRRKGWTRVWVECECNCTIDYNDEVSKLSKKCFTDRLPENGWYYFKEYGKTTWIITDSIKINRILNEDERQEILKNASYDEQEEWIPYRKAFEKRKGILGESA